MSILITTYEGTHNHPLPMSATAMASTTSAAASMLISGSSTSGPNPSSTTTASATLNGLNFYLSSDNSRSKPYYLPNSSISSSPSFPTITLDLTSNSSVSSSLSSSSSHLSRLNHFPPRYSTTNLNFSSLESNPLPLSWSNGMLSYGSQINNKNQTPSSLSFGPHQPYDQTLYQSYLQKSTLPNPNPSHQSLPPNHSHQPLPPNTIAAITSDPSFQSALAAALSSIIGSGAATNNNSSTLADQNIIERSTIKNGEAFPVLSSFPSTSPNANKCAPSFLNKSPPSTSSSQTGNFAFLSTPFSSSKSKSNSPGDHSRDH